MSQKQFKDYLDSMANIDTSDISSLKTFLSGLEIQAAQTESALAIIAPTWKISTKESLIDFMPDFENPDQRAAALCDFACIPVYSINPFFKNPAAIFAQAKLDRICPIEDDLSISDLPEVSSKFIPYVGGKYCIAADYSVSGDAMGIAMVCEYPFEHESYELIFSKQIKVSKDKEADYNAFENLCINLRNRGFEITKIGFDQFQSHHSKLNLENKNFLVEIVSYNESFACQRALKELIVTGKFIYGACDEVFMGEAAELQVINSKRIDHLTSGGVYNSCDVWAAVVNALKLVMDSPKLFETEYD